MIGLLQIRGYAEMMKKNVWVKSEKILNYLPEGGAWSLTPSPELSSAIYWLRSLKQGGFKTGKGARFDCFLFSLLQSKTQSTFFKASTSSKHQRVLQQVFHVKFDFSKRINSILLSISLFLPYQKSREILAPLLSSYLRPFTTPKVGRNPCTLPLPIYVVI